MQSTARLMEVFPEWFKKKILDLKSLNPSHVSDDLAALAWGPDRHIHIYQGCIVNGIRFITESREEGHKTQNSGVCVEGMHKGKDLIFYGVLSSVVELTYSSARRVFLFKCRWFDLERNKPEFVDDDMWSINTSRTWYDNDSYIFATQATQVCYTRDPKKRGHEWKVVQKIHHRHFFHPDLFVSNQQSECQLIEEPQSDEAFQQDISNVIPVSEIYIDLGALVRIGDAEDNIVGEGTSGGQNYNDSDFNGYSDED